MRIFIDPSALEAQTVLAENGHRASKPVGYFYDQHNQSYVLFIATDHDTGEPVTDVNGKVGLNVRAQSKRQQRAG